MIIAPGNPASREAGVRGTVSQGGARSSLTLGYYRLALFPLRTEATARQAGRQMEPSRGGWYEIELRNLAEQPGL